MSLTYQAMLRKLTDFWQAQNCVIHHGYDLEVGAGTFNPATFLKCLGPEPYRAAYIEPSRRPADGRYGDNPVRMQHYFQFQVILKPSPPNVQDLCLESLTAIGIDLSQHDVRFVHDDWESPTLGAWGLGWEVWLDGMEILQFTYFQCCGGQTLKPITAEITYGTERVARYLQKVESSFDLKWNDRITYGDIYHRNEIEWSTYNFEQASTEMWFRHFQDYERESKRLIERNLPLPAYDFVLKASHAFNMLEARRFFSVTERTGYIARIRDLARQVAEEYIASRERQGFPLLRHAERDSKSVVVPPLSPSLQKPQPEQKATFLLEIGSEELPATFVPIGMRNLEKSMRQLLDRERIVFGKLSVFGTPRRQAIQIQDVALGRPAETTEKRGPSVATAFTPDGMITKAGEGFFRSLSVEPPKLAEIVQGKVSQVEVREWKGEKYLIAHLQSEARSTGSLLAEALPKLVPNLDFPKKMRWGDGDLSYARPIRWIVAMLDEQPIPFAIGPIVAGTTSQGHRQRRPGPVAIDHAENYLQRLREHQVIADVSERESLIKSQIGKLESSLQAAVIAQDRVLPQVIHLVEYPSLMQASFQEEFLKVPKEVLISEMVEHQKYFPVAAKDGTLRNLFIITADAEPTEDIRRGNQKVLSARLFDGAFLYQQDLKTPLETFNESLKQVTYLQGLGSVYDKVERLVKHAKVLHELLPICDLSNLERAANLCKADLASAMVGEFPELQGTIGRTYALAQNEKPEVAQAIEEHWRPKNEEDELPSSAAGVILSLAERFDNILGCFAVGLQPTSSSDPYALRRQILGIVRMLIQGKYPLPLAHVLNECFQNLPANFQKDKAKVLADVKAFITSRIKTVFLEYQFRKDEIEASLSSGVADIYDTFCRVNALHQFRAASSQFSQLLEVYKRARGQINGQPNQSFSVSHLKEEAEKELHKALDRFEPKFYALMQQADYQDAYHLIAELQQPLAKLFEKVKILAEDPELQANRIALLQRVFVFFEELLDFDKIQEI